MSQSLEAAFAEQAVESKWIKALGLGVMAVGLTFGVVGIGQSFWAPHHVNPWLVAGGAVGFWVGNEIRKNKIN